MRFPPSRRRRAALLSFMILTALGSSTASAEVVISQVYGGGGNSGANYRQDFIELFNRGTEAVDLSGWSVQYAGANGSSWQMTALSNTVLQPGQYYLIQQAKGAGGQTDLPQPDVTGTIAMAAARGKIALVANQTALTGACPLQDAQAAQIRDFVGIDANCFEGAAAAPVMSSTTASLRAEGGCNDSGQNGNDFTSAAPQPRNSASPLHPCSTAPEPEPKPEQPLIGFSADVIAAAEGNDTPNTLRYRITFSPALADGQQVTFKAAVSGPAGRYDASAIPASITLDAQSSSPLLLDVLTVPDTVPNGNATVTLTLSEFNGTGAQQPDPLSKSAQILDDDPLNPVIAIAQVQGETAESPRVGQTVTVEGIVTAKANAGFWLQDNSCSTPLTASCGLYVYGNQSAAQVQVGDRVQASGRVTEYRPSADPQALPLTELTQSSVTVLAQNQPLPAPVDLSLTDNLPIPEGALDQLERFEGMRVSIPDFTVTAATNSGEYASSQSPGTFFGVISGTPRPMREPGIDTHNPLPSDNTAQQVPRWDFNPELLRVKSNLLSGSTALNLNAGDRLENLVGVLDYGFRRYTLLPAPDAMPTVIPGPLGVAVTAPQADEITVATFNVQNLVLGKPDYILRADKTARIISDYLHLPDIIGLSEIGNQASLDDLAGRISTAALAAGKPDPRYVGRVVNLGAYQQEVGVLYKTAALAGSLPRVTLGGDITQIGAQATLRCPDGSNTGDQLMDRPPLLAPLQIHLADGSSWPLTVLVNHLKSLSGVDSEDPPAPGFECFPSQGARNRAKRQQGAELLARWIEARQQAQPEERLVLIGDFNAHAFNDGFVDVIGTIIGRPSADDETVQPGDGQSLVTTPLLSLLDSVPDPESAYSYIHGSNAQAIDHILINQAVRTASASVRLEYAHVNAGYLKIHASTAGNVLRSSDHDPGIAYFRPAGNAPPQPDDIFADGFEN